jgi:flagellar motor switch protein FliN/FliY
MNTSDSDVSGATSAQSQIAGYCGAPLAGALNSLTSGGFRVTPMDRAEDAWQESAGGNLIWRQPFSVANDAVIWLQAGKGLWEAVGRMIMSGAGIQSITDEDCRSAWNEVVAQAMSGVAALMSDELGLDVAARDGGLSEEPIDASPAAVFEVRNGERNWIVRIAWTSQLAEACTNPVRRAADSVPSSQNTPSRTLDLLLDVSLPVSVSFGRTSLQIREVLKLNTGSIVELDRLMTEPVEVIVNNRVIARGDVVVVDGNYGVRIISLASREDRLRSGTSDFVQKPGVGGR